ncbi:GGDEF domain-containing protein [Candidatus Deferrimicrobium sp.]|uniref:GGDEF domain-containing protein n=1 Tax=Candidatus Deferrimicrobium sp. TaxID=3060586 RepID=UPI002EDB73AE
MVKTEGKRTRPEDFFLLALLLVNLVFGVGLLGALRANLSKELVAGESTLVSSKISAFLWGKILRFTSAVEQRKRVGEGAPLSGDAGTLTVVVDLPVEWNFQRIRSGTGEWLPVFVGTPRDLPNRGHVLPLGFLVPGGSRRNQRYVIEASSLADVDGYLGDLARRGILCRIVDPEGHILFGATGGFPARRDSASRFEGEAPVLGGALSREWSLQTFIPDASSRLPFLPQAVLATFFLLNMAALVYIRQRFLLPSGAALAAVTDAVAAQGEILPSRASPGDIAGALDSLLKRRRIEAEEEKRSIRESAERRTREISESQKSLLSHHRLTKKMLQSRQVDEVFEILLGGIADGYGFPGTLLGKVSSDGHLVFLGETDPASGAPLRIPLWHPGSLLARTFWSGNLLHASPRDLPHLPEEESILGSSAVLCIPVVRNLTVRCVEVKNCADRSCSSYYSENLKCWLRNISAEFFSGGGDPEIHRAAITTCLRCEVFPSSALLVVRSVGNGKVLTRENAVPLSNLASEAGLALEVVSIFDNMKIMAVTDGLTGLYNHREFYQSLRRELERARRYRHTLTLLMIDVDDFKRFNDRFGHPAGDIALHMIGVLLRKCARTTDIIARYGGEEFAVILPESTPGGALMVAERIKSEIAAHNFIQYASDTVHLTVSIGIYSSESGDVSEDQMVSFADEASYSAKKAGKNQVVVKAPV